MYDDEQQFGEQSSISWHILQNHKTCKMKKRKEKKACLKTLLAIFLYDKMTVYKLHKVRRKNSNLFAKEITCMFTK